MKTPQAYPLQWPASAPRTPPEKQGKAQFKTSLNAALSNVSDSLRLFGSDTGKPVKEVTLSSNVALGNQNPKDAGIAVWFIWEDEWRCIPVDRYARPEHNLQAIHHIIEARRTEFRHGGLYIAKAAFSGFTPALEGPNANRPWRTVFGQAAEGVTSRESLDKAYRTLAKERHPDRAGGSDALMSELNVAYQQAQKEL